ncbi:HNH endonuclease signature motif containing protein [Arthrobacter sp. USHLN218]|uniref:HNH endonuclease signature motif containing protein n=1 Tax=Arthrobacter sp. USHLN218 TaxID=3081232 RepID=UPI0030170C84
MANTSAERPNGESPEPRHGSGDSRPRPDGSPDAAATTPDPGEPAASCDRPDSGPAVGVCGVGLRPTDPFSCRPPWEEHSWEEGEAVDAEGIPLDAPDTPIPLYVLTGHDAPPEEDPWAAARGAFTPPAWEPVLPARSGQIRDLLPLLGSREPSRLLYEEAAHELIAARRASAWLEARILRLLNALVREAVNEQPHGWPPPLGPGTPDEHLAEAAAVAEAAAALQIPERTAAIRINYARTIAGECPATLETLEQGHLTGVQAAIITDETTSLPPRARPGFEHELLDLAPVCSTGSLRRRARTLREKRHPETITARRAKKAADRHLELKPDYDGMAWLSAYLPAETAVAAFNHVQAIALSVQGPEELRTLTQLRADALTHLLLSSTPKPQPPPAVAPAPGTEGPGASDAGATAGAEGPGATEAAIGAGGPTEAFHPAAGPGDLREHPALDGGLPPGAGYGIVPTVALTIPALTLLGLGQEPAHLDGYGPIPIEAAARLAANAPSFTRVLTDPVTGAVLAMDRKQYRPTAAQRRYLRLLYEKCTFYGCSRSSEHCELDHTIGWAEGGSTDTDNLGPECKRHHRLKTETDWNLQQPNPGEFDWTSPAGISYPTRPEPLVHTPPEELASILERHEIHTINTKLRAYYQRKHQQPQQTGHTQPAGPAGQGNPAQARPAALPPPTGAPNPPDQTNAGTPRDAGHHHNCGPDEPPPF